MVILYVDDDKDDRELFSEAVKNIDSSYTIIEAKDGHDAIHIANHIGKGHNEPGNSKETLGSLQNWIGF